jgi:predicted transcriptional regulator
MSEDATQQFLAERVEQIVSMLSIATEELKQVKNQQYELSSRMARLETKVDERLYDTRPILENVLSQIAELDKKTESRIEELRSETASGFRAVDRKIGALSKNLIDMTADRYDG